MENTQQSRRLDSLGRLVIPKKLRDRYNIETDREYVFFYHIHDNKKYLCIEIGVMGDEIQRAKELLEKAGYEVGSRTNA